MIQGNVCQGIPFIQPLPTRTVVTSASLVDWGTYLGSLKIQGLCSEQEVLMHINVLELCVIYNACLTFLDHIKSSVVHLLTDNTTVM